GVRAGACERDDRRHGADDEPDLDRAEGDPVHAASSSLRCRSARVASNAPIASSFIAASISCGLNFAYSKSAVSVLTALSRTARPSASGHSNFAVRAGTGRGLSRAPEWAAPRACCAWAFATLCRRWLWVKP